MNQTATERTEQEWEIRHVIDSIYGHLPTAFYIEASKAENAYDLLNKIMLEYSLALLDLNEEFKMDMVKTMEKIIKIPELTSYFFEKLKSYSEVLKLTKPELFKEAAEA